MEKEDYPELGFPPGYWEISEDEGELAVSKNEKSNIRILEGQTLGNTRNRRQALTIPEKRVEVIELSDNTCSDSNNEKQQQSPAYKNAQSEVRVNSSGQLQWRREGEIPWRNAVYHSTIRDDLIAEANRVGKYKYPRAKGKHVTNDVTCFHPGQEEWGAKRENWPEIVFQYLPGPGYISTAKPGYWFTREGLLVIDVHNNPILNYPEIPSTLSSQIEPVFMEAYYRWSRKITQADLRARMVDHPKGGKYNGQGDDPIRLGNLGMKMNRFRSQAGCIAWGARKASGSEAFRNYMDKLLPKHCKDANSIKGFRNLHKHEVEEMKLNNVGMFLERTRGCPFGPKDMSATKRTALYEKALQKFRQSKAEFEAKQARERKETRKAKVKPVLESPDESDETICDAESLIGRNQYAIEFLGLSGTITRSSSSTLEKATARKNDEQVRKWTAINDDQPEETESSEAEMESDNDRDHMEIDDGDDEDSNSENDSDDEMEEA